MVEGAGGWQRMVEEWFGWQDGWIGQISGGWRDQWQVLRSAPLNMMLLDGEEQLTTIWKRQWRKAISGDPEKRVRDHMSDPEVQKRVKLYDTASFTFGVSMCMLTEYLLLVHSSAFPLFYLTTFAILVFLRYMTYKAIKYHYFLIDFCYFLNVSSIFQSLVCSGTEDSGLCSGWLKVNYVQSHGPIALAILAWKNSVVFHSMDKMTSYYIHIMPALLNYQLRWNSIPDSVVSTDLSLSFFTAIFMPSIVFAVWQAWYLYIQTTIIDHDPSLVTSLRYLTQNPRNPMYVIVRDVCVSLGIFKKEESYDTESTKTKTIFIIGQFVYMLVCIIPIPLLFYFRFLNTVYLVLLIVAAIWRGGSYYVFHFTKTYNQKFDSSKKNTE